MMAREASHTNTREGKWSLRNREGHNRHPGGKADMRTLSWRAWRRQTQAWLRALIRQRDA